MFDLHSRTVENVEFYNKNQKNAHQIHINVEKYRIPEVLFKPYLSGCDERGVSEILESMYKVHHFDTLYLTGCLSKIKGLENRLLHDLQSNLPTGTTVAIYNDSINQAYTGAFEYYKSANKNAYITKKEYTEYGAEYTKEHLIGNPYQYQNEESQ
eukprot:NODE_13_length_54415_cov_0.522424.p36 type:complete len:155 gc:universal NODE_13_length_54415_cov_0.522424:34821-34357(-)